MSPDEIAQAQRDNARLWREVSELQEQLGSPPYLNLEEPKPMIESSCSTFTISVAEEGSAIDVEIFGTLTWREARQLASLLESYAVIAKDNDDQKIGQEKAAGP